MQTQETAARVCSAGGAVVRLRCEKRQKGVQETRDLEATESVKESGFIPHTVRSLCGICVFLENVLRLW